MSVVAGSLKKKKKKKIKICKNIMLSIQLMCLFFIILFFEVFFFIIYILFFFFFFFLFFFFKQKTAYEMVSCDWSSDVCSSDLPAREATASTAGARSASSG